MHSRIAELYGTECEHCNHTSKIHTLTLGLGDSFKSLLTAVEKAFKLLHKNKNYKPDDLLKTPEYLDVIVKTNGILSSVFQDNDISAKMLKSLKEDVFLFSGLKTHAQLTEASKLLLTDDNKIKSFNVFSNDVAKIKKNYNENYLEAEYDFAVGSAQMAERWDNFSDSDRYYLQYRTAGDSKVRESHAKLNNITLPKNDVFWDKYFPPNGWRCRCNTIEVLTTDNKKANSKKAIEKGEVATTEIGKSNENKLAIFRFNSGRQKVIFPPTHPYHKVAGANKVKTNIAKKK